MRVVTRTLLCSAIAVMLVGCSSSSKTSAASTTSSTSSSDPTATTAGVTPSSTGVTPTTSSNGSGSDPKATGSFCADVRNGAVSSALADAAVPSAAGNSLDQMKKIDGEAPSEIKSDVDTMLRILTQIHDASSDSAKQAALATDGQQLSTAGTNVGNYITAHCAR